MLKQSWFVVLAVCIAAAAQNPVGTPDEQAIASRLKTLRQVPDDARGDISRELAAAIRKLPQGSKKLRLARELTNLSTEGDFGGETLRQVAVTLAEALREQSTANVDDGYRALAQLVRYEGVLISMDNNASFAAAMAKLEEDDRRRAAADIVLRDLQGKEWKLSSLRGKVVLVNFWATWCPPCRKEIPDLEALYSRFQKDGLMILAISAEDIAKVKPFVEQNGMKYPVLLDPGGEVNKAFGIDGIPKSFVYDRGGRLVATAIDMRTRGQFLAMLAKAGLN